MIKLLKKLFKKNKKTELKSKSDNINIKDFELSKNIKKIKNSKKKDLEKQISHVRDTNNSIIDKLEDLSQKLDSFADIVVPNTPISDLTDKLSKVITLIDNVFDKDKPVLENTEIKKDEIDLTDSLYKEQLIDQILYINANILNIKNKNKENETFFIKNILDDLYVSYVELKELSVIRLEQILNNRKELYLSLLRSENN